MPDNSTSATSTSGIKRFDAVSSAPNEAAKLIAGIQNRRDSVTTEYADIEDLPKGPLPFKGSADDEIIYAQIQAVRRGSVTSSTVAPAMAPPAELLTPSQTRTSPNKTTNINEEDRFGFLFGNVKKDSATAIPSGGSDKILNEEHPILLHKTRALEEQNAALKQEVERLSALDLKSNALHEPTLMNPYTLVTPVKPKESPYAPVTPLSRSVPQQQTSIYSSIYGAGTSNPAVTPQSNTYVQAHIQSPNPSYATIHPNSASNPSYATINPNSASKPLHALDSGIDAPQEDPYGFLYGRITATAADNSNHAVYYDQKTQLDSAAPTVATPRIVGKAAENTANVKAGVNDLKVELQCDTPGATIYYTLNGYVPRADGSNGSVSYNVVQPSIPTDVGGTTILTAIATKSGMHDSKVMTRTIVIPGASPVVVTMSPPDNNHTNFVSVYMSSDTLGAQMYYTVDGSPPVPMKSPTYNPANVPRVSTLRPNRVTLNAIAYKPGLASSKCVTEKIEIPQVDAPIIYRDFPQYTISIRPVTHDSVIYYSIDGEEPSLDFWTAVSQSSLYDTFDKPTIDSTGGPTKVTVCARGYKDQWAPSEVSVAVISIDMCPPPTFGTMHSDELSTVMNNQLQIKSPALGASILYSLNGQVPRFIMSDFGVVEPGNNFTFMFDEHAPPEIVPSDSDDGYITVTAIAVVEGMLASRPIAVTFVAPEKNQTSAMKLSDAQNPYNTLLALQGSIMEENPSGIRRKRSSFHLTDSSAYSELNACVDAIDGVLIVEKDPSQNWGFSLRQNSNFGAVVSKVDDETLERYPSLEKRRVIEKINGLSTKESQYGDVMYKMKSDRLELVLGPVADPSDVPDYRVSYDLASSNTSSYRTTEPEPEPEPEPQILEKPVPEPDPKLAATVTKLTSNQTEEPNVIVLGSRCSVEGYDSEGYVRFMGNHAENGKQRIGVELDLPVGKNNGTIKGHTYFQCEPKHGVLVAPGKVAWLPSPLATADALGDEHKLSENVSLTLTGSDHPLPTEPVGTSLKESSPIAVGSRVMMKGYNCLGTVKFVGTHVESGKSRIGVELDEAVGKHNGTVKGHTYFTCDAKKGILPAPSKVLRAPDVCFTMTRTKEQAWGVSISCNQGLGAVVTAVDPEGACATYSKITVNSTFSHINGNDTAEMTKDAVLDMLAEATQLLVALGPDLASSNVGSVTMGGFGANDVVLQKNENESWGMGIKVEAGIGIRITKVKAGGAGERNQVPVGTVLETINGVETKTMTREEALNILKSNSLLSVTYQEKNATDSGPTIEPLQGAPNSINYSDMGRTELLKTLRKANIDYSSANGLEDLRNLAKEKLTGVTISHPEDIYHNERRSDKIEIGSRVNIVGYDCLGTVMYMGPHAKSGKPRIGIELDKPIGKHNGTAGGHTYFSCREMTGILPAPSKVSLAPSDGNSAVIKSDTELYVAHKADEATEFLLQMGSPDFLPVDTDAVYMPETGDDVIATKATDDVTGSLINSSVSGSDSCIIERNEGEPWGMGIGHDTTYGLKINKIKETGAALRYASQLRKGRSIAEVNGTRTASVTKKELIDMLKSSTTLNVVFGPDFGTDSVAP